MKEMSEEIACVVVPLPISEWLKCKNQGNDKNGHQKFWEMKWKTRNS